MSTPTGQPSLVIRLFGTFEALRNQKPLPATRTRKEQWLLALLLLRHPTPVERTWLAYLFWPDSTEARALQNLRRSLNNLRQILGADASRLLTPTPRTLGFDVSNVDIDVLCFDAAIVRGDRAGREEAITLYRGALLEGCDEDWLLPERVQREAAFLQALETLAEEALFHQDYSESIGFLRRILALEPGRESTLCTLLQALAASGDAGGLVEAYRDFRHYLHRELNTTPTPETAALFRQLRQPRASFSPPIRADTQTSQESRDRNAVPLPLNRLIGRDKEVEKITSLLGRHRLVALIGPGGIGKTRLAQAVAQTASERYTDGVWFVPLADVTSPKRLPEAVRDALGLPRSAADPLTQIQDRLTTCNSLLLLDNLEHLLPEAARFLYDLRQRLPALTLLTTSRVRLHLVGEKEFAVSPLPVPTRKTLLSHKPHDRAENHPTHANGDASLDPDTLMEYSGVQLFVHRAQGRRAEFQVTESNAASVSAVCSTLEGIPLAIELAAAWMHLLTPAQLLTRLQERFALLKSYREDNLPERHRSLWTALETSYRLLSPELQQFFVRLSVFRGGWTLAAAETVCEEPRALEFLAHLHDASLLVAEEVGEEMRYRFLETLREYAAEQSTTEEREVVAHHHADYFMALAEVAQPHWHTGEEGRWLSKLEADHANFREALAYYLQSEVGEEEGCRLMRLLGIFWERRGYFREGCGWLSQALADKSISPHSRMKALNVQGFLYYRQCLYDPARLALEEALALARQLDEKLGVKCQELFFDTLTSPGRRVEGMPVCLRDKT